MNIIISLLAIYGIAYGIKEIDGPWGILSWARNKLMTNKYAGVFFYKLLNCYYCVGFHAGWIVYLLQATIFKINLLIIWGLAGAVICLILDGLVAKLYSSIE